MIYFAGAETTRVQCAYASIEEVSKSCEEIGEIYADYKGEEILKEKEEQPEYVHEVRLTAPIHRFTKAAAYLVSDQNMVSETWVKVNAKLDFMDARRVFNQLIELGIIESCQSPYHVKGSHLRRVLIHNKEEIAMLIEKFS